MAVNFSFEELVLLSDGRIIDKILPTLEYLIKIKSKISQTF